MFPHLKGFNLQKWIDENRADWGQRRVIWQDSDFIAFVTRGPNRRKDYISIRATRYFTSSKVSSTYTPRKPQARSAVLHAGDIFLLPKNIPHSPRRADGSWTYVVETPARQRRNRQIYLAV